MHGARSTHSRSPWACTELAASRVSGKTVLAWDPAQGWGPPVLPGERVPLPPNLCALLGTFKTKANSRGAAGRPSTSHP